MQPSAQPGKVYSWRTSPLMPRINAWSRRLAKSFYAYNLARESVKVAESSSQTAETVHSAVEARVTNGLATQPELLQAEQQLAQAQFDLEKARGSERDAFVDLMEAIGLSPAVQIRITEGLRARCSFDLETPACHVRHARPVAAPRSGRLIGKGKGRRRQNQRH